MRKIRVPTKLRVSSKQVNALDTILRDSTNIAVLSHTSPDEDAFGSAVGLATLLDRNYRANVYVFFEDDVFPKWLGIVPQSQKLIKKVDEIATALVEYRINTVIAVDINHYHRLTQQDVDKLRDIIEGSIKHRIVIDHHVDSPPEMGDLRIMKGFSSCAELVAHIAWRLDWEFTYDAASALLLGILGDTARLKFLKHDFTLDFISRLLKLGADWHKAYDATIATLDPEHYELILYMVNNVHIDPEARVVSLVVPNAVYSKYRNVGYEAVKNWFLAEVFRLLNVRAGIYIVEKEPGKYFVSLRRIKDDGLRMNEFAFKFGGGGHVFSAGFRFLGTEYSPEEIIRSFKEFVKSHGA